MGRRRSFGTIRKKGKKFFAEYTGPDVKRHSAGRGFTKEADASYWLAQEQRLIELDTWTPPKTRRVQAGQEPTTVAELLEEWINRPGIAHTTRDINRRVLNMRVLSPAPNKGGQPLPAPLKKLATLPIAEVKKHTIRTWWESLEGYYGATDWNRKALKFLKSAFKRAVDDELINVSPVTITPGKPDTELEKYTPTEEEVRAIINAAPNAYKGVIGLGLWSGLRIGEVRALEPRHIVFKEIDGRQRMFAHVEQNMSRDRSAKPLVDRLKLTPKTNAGNRLAAIPSFLEPCILEAIEGAKKRSPVKRPLATGGTTDFLALFVNTSGNPFTDILIQDKVTELAKKVGTGGRVHLHAGRRFATRRIMSHTHDPAQVGAQLGQIDQATILNVYNLDTHDKTELLARVMDG